MMKSFFKKLAFVMALAMVVSAMAPAATAKAADDFGICLQEDANYTIIETYEMTEGDEPQDFKFAGAPKNWKDYKWTWTSSNEKAATVDAKSGLVTVVAAGQTTIKVASDDNAYAGELALTVKAATVAEDKSFTVKQTGSNTLELTFADKKFAVANVAIEKLGKTTTGAETVLAWAVKSAIPEGNVVKVTTWVPLQAGDYRFMVNGEKVEKYLEIGKPHVIEFDYEKPYPYDNNAPITPKVTVKDANGVVLTGYDSKITYELVNKDADAYLEADGKLYFWKVGAVAQIQAVLTLDDGTPVRGYNEIKCREVPTTTMNNYVEKFAVIKDGTEAKDVKWNVDAEVIITLPTETDRYFVAGLIGNSDGKYVSINEKYKTNDVPVISTSEYKLVYTSSNPTVALVDDEKGEILGVKEGNVFVLVDLKKYNGTKGEWELVGTVAAIPVTVKAARKATDFTLDSYSATVLTAGKFTEVTVKATVKDQYRNDIADPIVSVSAKVNKDTYSNANGYVNIVDAKTFKIDASKFASVNANALQFTVKTKSGLERNYTLSIKKLPALVNETYALDAKGAEIAKSEKATVKVVSSWSGYQYEEKSFYWGKPAYSTDVKIGDLYVVVTDPNGNEVKSTWATATGSAIELPTVIATATPGALKTIANGTYVVKLYKVTQSFVNSKEEGIVNGSECNTSFFEVTKNLKAVTDFKVTANTYKADNTYIIDKDNYTFKYDGKLWKDTSIVVSAVNKKELDGKVFVYDFTVQIPFGNDGTYYEQKITVGELFELAQ